jgi:hypothetical protein
VVNTISSIALKTMDLNSTTSTLAVSAIPKAGPIDWHHYSKSQTYNRWTPLTLLTLSSLLPSPTEKGTYLFPQTHHPIRFVKTVAVVIAADTYDSGPASYPLSKTAMTTASSTDATSTTTDGSTSQSSSSRFNLQTPAVNRRAPKYKTVLTLDDSSGEVLEAILDLAELRESEYIKEVSLTKEDDPSGRALEQGTTSPPREEKGEEGIDWRLELSDAISVGTVLAVRGLIKEFRGVKQIVVKRLGK